MTDDGLEVILHSANELARQARTEMARLTEDRLNQQSQLNDLDRTADALLAHLGIDHLSTARYQKRQPLERPNPSDGLTVEAVRWRAEQRIIAAGFDPSEVALDGLVDAEYVAMVRRRYERPIRQSAKLDRVDVLAAIAAGLMGALIDETLVGSAASSPVTGAIRKLFVVRDGHVLEPVVGWLEGQAKVPFDPIIYPIGWTPNTHRAMTFGHDPLLGLVMGTLDILRSTATGFSTDGVLIQTTGRSAVPITPFEALGLVVLHLLSDVLTPAGLPLPGWTALPFVPDRWVAAPTGRPAAQITTEMYRKGFNTWHLPAMSLTPKAVELVCQAYWDRRIELDSALPESAGNERLDHPRYLALSLLAHSVASAADLSAAFLTGDALRINYAQCLQLATRLAHFLARPRVADIPRILLENQDEIDTGWAELAEVRAAAASGSLHQQ